MTDRIRVVTVRLDRDYRDDDAEPILAALRMVKCVAAVEPQTVQPKDYVARELARDELRAELARKLLDILNGKDPTT